MFRRVDVAIKGQLCYRFDLGSNVAQRHGFGAVDMALSLEELQLQEIRVCSINLQQKQKNIFSHVKTLALSFAAGLNDSSPTHCTVSYIQN